MKPTPLNYPAGSTTCKGAYYMPPEGDGPHPVVLVCHAWDGLLPEVHDKAARLAQAGYIAFAIDVFGDGKTYDDPADLMPALTPYMENRQLILDRMQGAVAAARTIPGADPNRIAAIGYCFGGTCVLDLARAEVAGHVAGVVSFHGGLAGNALEHRGTISSKVLVLHGEDDPLVPPEQVAEFKAEMDGRGADWQLIAYSNTLHAFTRPKANDPAFGAMYNPLTDQRSWQAMLSFLDELFPADA